MKTATRPEEQSSRAHGHHITTSSRTVSMSSREIAELTGKAHDNVLRDIRVLVKKGVLKTEETIYIHLQNGQQYPEFLLNKRDTLVLVSGYDAHLRAKIIDRWIELESQQAPRIPQTFGEALRLAADQAEQIEQQQKALAIAAPKAAFVDQYVEASGTMIFREVAKLLKANERKLRELLKARKIMYRLSSGEWVPYQSHIDAGRFEVKTGTSERNNRAFTQARFTPKGFQWIAGLWNQHQIKGEA